LRAPPKPPVVAISIGCPSGIGPEVAVAAAARSTEARCLLVGDLEVIHSAATLRRVSRRRLVPVASATDLRALDGRAIGVFAGSAPLGAPSVYGAPDRAAGAAQLAWIDQACDLVRAGLASALVTGPVSKKVIAGSGAAGAERFRGHTEHLAERLGAAEVVMAFSSERLTTALVTTHLPLAAVPAAITPEAVATTTYWLARLCQALGRQPSSGPRRSGPRRPRIAVAALNPHAGEGGLLGDEEMTRITPGIERARARLAAEGLAVEITGPLGAETALRVAARGAYDGVVTMYHDQATIPSKLLGFGEAVNVTLGLPIVRTSVDHGTAYDLAGTGEADARGMREAIALAVRLCRAKAPL
jgi:4-hydroxythreonine-4-phosphate dehydrogenase